MAEKKVVKVRILKGFMLPGQGYYRQGSEVTLRFERAQSVGVLTPALYEKLLERGSIEPIEKKEVSNGEILSQKR